MVDESGWTVASFLVHSEYVVAMETVTPVEVEEGVSSGYNPYVCTLLSRKELSHNRVTHFS